MRFWNNPFTALDRIERKLDRLLVLAGAITNKETLVMADVTKIQADVAAQNTVVGSVVTLLQQLKTSLDAAGTDPAALAALSQQIEANTQALSAAVVANTPAA